MSTVGHEIRNLSREPNLTAGPVTRRYQRRTLTIYLAAVALGALPLVFDMSGGWQAVGLGLWMPGAGFLATGGWSALLFPLTLALFALAVVAWFWAGMVVAPVAVWLGSAALAAALAPAEVAPVGHVLAAIIMVAGAFYVRQRIRARHARDEARAAARRTYVPASLVEVEQRAARVPDAATRELTQEQIQSLRYLLDRALQPVEAFDGFTIIDQFQPAALRYQLNHMGFALGIAQGSYVPSFHGYMHVAQRNLIEKYLLRRVWGYWVYESCWGHLNFTNFDPAARDNIMLTGWFGMHVGQYMLNSGDRRYAEPGSLTFRLNARTAYEHDHRSIVQSVVENYAHYENEFCLYPCEPNWMYPICNHYGMTALANHDRLYGTTYRARTLPTWLEKLDREFTDRSGTIIGLRSQLTGIEFPFPTGEAGYANFANCFAPERARRLWAVARKEIEPAITVDAAGRQRITLPGRGLDAGGYHSGFVGAFGSIMSAAREFGDEEIAQAAQRSLDQDCSPRFSDGSLGYLAGSNLTNVSVAMGRLMGTGDFRRSFVEGPSEATLAGPYLTGVDYPAVLVARAWSNGADLDLVMYPGKDPGPQTLTIERLAPGARYDVSGALSQQIEADARGSVRLTVHIDGRTPVTLKPA
jgi:hypothetical protein